MDGIQNKMITIRKTSLNLDFQMIRIMHESDWHTKIQIQEKIHGWKFLNKYIPYVFLQRSK
jgi:hypothetical protein